MKKTTFILPIASYPIFIFTLFVANEIKIYSIQSWRDQKIRLNQIHESKVTFTFNYVFAAK
jgi:hypothetical protein